MKVKLLKKIRRRFEVYYNENGIIYNGNNIGRRFAVVDKYDEWFLFTSNEKKKCIDAILKVARKEYGKREKKLATNKRVVY